MAEDKSVSIDRFFFKEVSSGSFCKTVPSFNLQNMLLKHAKRKNGIYFLNRPWAVQSTFYGRINSDIQTAAVL
jgi:hypothetical protein